MDYAKENAPTVGSGESACSDTVQSHHYSAKSSVNNDLGGTFVLPESDGHASVKKKISFADYLATTYQSPEHVAQAMHHHAASVAAIYGVQLPDNPIFNGGGQYTPNPETDKNDKRQGYWAEYKDSAGVILPAYTFHSFRGGGKSQHWTPREVLWSDYEAYREVAQSTQPNFSAEDYRARAAELEKESARKRAEAELLDNAGRVFVAHSARQAWEAAKPNTGHDYLARKGIVATDARVATKGLTGTLYNQFERKNFTGNLCNAGDLLIPLYNEDGLLVNIQRIDADGKKRFLNGGQTKGCFYQLSGIEPALVVEGFADGVSVNQATGRAVYVAFSAYNLKHVCESQLSIGGVAADDGEAGIKAAKETGLPYLTPPNENGVKGWDWNDYALQHGLEAVREQLNSLTLLNRSQAELETAAQESAHSHERSTALPLLPPELAALPDGLGEIQKYIYGTMTYPCWYMAGWTAISTFTGFAQTHVTIDSQQGLGLNEYYLTLAPTGAGKEALRDPLNNMMRELGSDPSIRNINQHLPEVEFSAPSSRQGLHQILENTPNHSVYVQSDEFAEWLKVAYKDQHKASALAYLMEVYTKALRSIHPGRAVTGKYETVRNPRLSIFATTTAESLVSTLSKDSAEMGAYNRLVTFVAPDGTPQKRYSGMQYNITPEALDAVKWVIEIDTKHMKLEYCAWKSYVRHDSEVAEPIRQADNLLGGRLSEQAIKMAGLFALSAKRTHILACDMDLAYKIRLGLYYRAKALIDESGAISGNHETGKALEQLENLFKANQSLYISQFKNRSRAFRGLSLLEQQTVINALLSRGIAEKVNNSPKIMASLVYGEP